MGLREGARAGRGVKEELVGTLGGKGGQGRMGMGQGLLGMKRPAAQSILRQSTQ